MIYKPKNFIIQELVDSEAYKKRGDKAWELLDPMTLATLQFFRMKFGSCMVNNWHKGGEYEWRGLRGPACEEYSRFSQHVFGRAFDCTFKDATAEEVRQWVKKYWVSDGMYDMYGPITMEDGVSWFHFDTRQISEKISSFKV